MEMRQDDCDWFCLAMEIGHHHFSTFCLGKIRIILEWVNIVLMVFYMIVQDSLKKKEGIIQSLDSTTVNSGN